MWPGVQQPGYWPSRPTDSMGKRSVYEFRRLPNFLPSPEVQPGFLQPNKWILLVAGTLVSIVSSNCSETNPGSCLGKGGEAVTQYGSHPRPPTS